MREQHLRRKSHLSARLFIAFLLVFAIPSGTASAKDLGGRLGIGLEQTLGGVTGISLRYWPGDAFGLSLTIGGEFTSFQVQITPVDNASSNTDNGEAGAATPATESRLAATVKASIGFTYNFARSTNANLGVGMRLAMGFQNQSASVLTNYASPGAAVEQITAGTSQFSLEVPLTVEFFFSDHFSASVALGFVFAFNPKEDVLIAPGQGDTKDASLLVNFGGAGIGGSLGIFYYF